MALKGSSRRWTVVACLLAADFLSTAAACSGRAPAPVQSNSAQALTSCRHRGLAEAGHSSRNAQLRAAFSASGTTYAAWQQRFHFRRAEAIAKAAGQPGPDPAQANGPPDGFALRHLSDAELFVCYFDGNFATSLPPGGPPPFNRLVVEVARDGDSDTYLYGYHGVTGQPDLPLERPAA